MAAIDKTYLKEYSEYKQLRDWCEQLGQVTDDYGNKFSPADFLIQLTEKEWNDWADEQRQHALQYYDNEEHTKQCKELYGEDWTFNVENYVEIPIWNTPTYFDIWLIRNCPFDFIQDRLKSQYGAGWSKTAFKNKEDESRYDYDAIIERCSIWDKFERNGVKNPHYNIQWKLKDNLKDRDCFWWISVEDQNGNSLWHDSYNDYWMCDNEPVAHDSMSNYAHMHGEFNTRKLYRQIKKWNLPLGSTVHVSVEYHRYVVYEFTLKIKK